MSYIGPSAGRLGLGWSLPETAAALVLTKVATTAQGSAIGNMAPLAALFDGVTSEGTNTTIVSSRGFGGKAWDAAKTIGQMAVWDPSNEGFCSNGSPVTIRVLGNSSNNPGTAVALASVRGAYTFGTIVVTVAQSDIDTGTAYPYHWAQVSGGGGASNVYLAEVEFWELL